MQGRQEMQGKTGLSPLFRPQRMGQSHLYECISEMKKGSPSSAGLSIVAEPAPMSAMAIFRQRPSTAPIVSGIPRLSDMAYFKEPSGVGLSLSSYISSALYGIPEPMAIWQHRLIHLPEDVLLHQCAGLNRAAISFPGRARCCWR